MVKMSRKNSLMAHLDPEWTEDILIYALRYTLGRSSYAPGVCQDYLKPLVPFFTKKALGVMIRDIEREISEFENLPYRKQWGELLRSMKAEKQQSRGENR